MGLNIEEVKKSEKEQQRKMKEARERVKKLKERALKRRKEREEKIKREKEFRHLPYEKRQQLKWKYIKKHSGQLKHEREARERLRQREAERKKTIMIGGTQQKIDTIGVDEKGQLISIAPTLQRKKLIEEKKPETKQYTAQEAYEFGIISKSEMKYGKQHNFTYNITPKTISQVQHFEALYGNELDEILKKRAGNPIENISRAKLLEQMRIYKEPELWLKKGTERYLKSGVAEKAYESATGLKRFMLHYNPFINYEIFGATLIGKDTKKLRIKAVAESMAKSDIRKKTLEFPELVYESVITSPGTQIGVTLGAGALTGAALSIPVGFIGSAAAAAGPTTTAAFTGTAFGLTTGITATEIAETEAAATRLEKMGISKEYITGYRTTRYTSIIGGFIGMYAGAKAMMGAVRLKYEPIKPKDVVDVEGKIIVKEKPVARGVVFETGAKVGKVKPLIFKSEGKIFLGKFPETEAVKQVVLDLGRQPLTPLETELMKKYSPELKAGEKLPINLGEGISELMIKGKTPREIDINVGKPEPLSEAEWQKAVKIIRKEQGIYTRSKKWFGSGLQKAAGALKSKKVADVDLFVGDAEKMAKKLVTELGSGFEAEGSKVWKIINGKRVKVFDIHDVESPDLYSLGYKGEEYYGYAGRVQPSVKVKTKYGKINVMELPEQVGRQLASIGSVEEGEIIPARAGSGQPRYKDVVKAIEGLEYFYDETGSKILKSTANEIKAYYGEYTPTKSITIPVSRYVEKITPSSIVSTTSAGISLKTMKINEKSESSKKEELSSFPVSSVKRNMKSTISSTKSMYESSVSSSSYYSKILTSSSKVFSDSKISVLSKPSVSKVSTSISTKSASELPSSMISSLNRSSTSKISSLLQPSTPTLKPSFKPMPKVFEEFRLFKKKPTYEVFAREKGKWLSIGKFTSKLKALEYGAKLTDITKLTEFKIKKGKKSVDISDIMFKPDILKKFTKTGKIFVEKKKYRFDYPTERKTKKKKLKLRWKL